MYTFKLFYHPIYTFGIDKSSKFPRERYELVRKQLEEKKILIDFQTPTLAKFEDIILSHDKGYANSFINGLLSQKEIRKIGLQPWKKDIINRTLYILGGSIEAMKSAIKGKNLAGNMAGGTHHAHFSYGSGYCIFNDLAVCAIKAVNDFEEINKVLIIDLDVHQGDGTATILENYKNIFTFSMHCENNFPLKKAKGDLDVSLKKGMHDNQYLEILEKNIEIIKNKDIDLILFQAGVDILAEDSLGYLKISRCGVKKRNQIVFDFANEKKVPLVIFMGGGYSKPIQYTVNSFVDLFTQCSDYARLFN